jgi:hypothetical protein
MTQPSILENRSAEVSGRAAKTFSNHVSARLSLSAVELSASTFGSWSSTDLARSTGLRRQTAERILRMISGFMSDI